MWTLPSEGAFDDNYDDDDLSIDQSMSRERSMSIGPTESIGGLSEKPRRRHRPRREWVSCGATPLITSYGSQTTDFVAWVRHSESWKTFNVSAGHCCHLSRRTAEHLGSQAAESASRWTLYAGQGASCVCVGVVITGLTRLVFRSWHVQFGRAALRPAFCALRGAPGRDVMTTCGFWRPRRWGGRAGRGE